MTYILFILGIAIAYYGKFYVMNHKKKLSNENLIEFEKTIKPKILKFIYLSILPCFALCFYLISGPIEINIWYLIVCAIVLIILSTFGYIKSQKIVNQSQNSEQFKYILNYFIFFGIGLLIIILAIAYSLKDFLVY